MPGHSYRAQVQWAGSTAAGYEAYPRAHSAFMPPATDGLDLSADGAFRGDPDLPNPEQLATWRRIATEIAKATEGTAYIDPLFATNRADAMAVGIAFGAYHFARPDLHPFDPIPDQDHHFVHGCAQHHAGASDFQRRNAAFAFH